MRKKRRGASEVTLLLVRSFAHRFVFPPFLGLHFWFVNMNSDQNPGFLLYIYGMKSCPVNIGIRTNHDKNPQLPTTISWKVKSGCCFHCSCVFLDLTSLQRQHIRAGFFRSPVLLRMQALKTWGRSIARRNEKQVLQVVVGTDH